MILRLSNETEGMPADHLHHCKFLVCQECRYHIFRFAAFFSHNAVHSPDPLAHFSQQTY